MPVTPTYPGVYVEEVPSGVRTITGVATSITAFLGRAERGPADKAVTIGSFADFERRFGGLWRDSTLGYAVRDFFLNGGSQAIVVRLFKADTGPGAAKAKASLDVKGLPLEADSEGEWGNLLRARVDHDVSGPDAAVLFNLSVRDGTTGQIEVHRNVAVASDHPRRIDKVLRNESRLVKVMGVLPSKPSNHDDPPSGGDVWADNTPATCSSVANAGKASNGQHLTIAEFTGTGKEDGKKGLYALEQADLFNLLCIPPYKANGNVDPALVDTAAAYCEKRRAMLLVDPPTSWTDKDTAKNGVDNLPRSKNAAVFFPRLKEFDPLRENRLEEFAPCGAVAGVFARTDAQRGVWKAPAGLDATLVGVPQLAVPLTDAENGELNPKGVNCLRSRPAAGRVVWGARTLVGDDRLASEWKYIPVRRTALFLEESLYRATQWVVFEPNDEPLWAQIRLNVGAFLQTLFLQGAFQGASPREAYFVKCDKETTTQSHVNLGIVNVVVGFAPLKPAEFVIIRIQQLAGQIEV